jgi:hypothetical protein
MKIKRYGNFSINEKVNQDDKYEIEQVLVEFIQDHGFILEIKEMFFNENKSDYSTQIDNTYKIPALQLSLYKKGSDVDISRSTIDNIIGLSYECVGKLGDVFDDVRVHHLSFDKVNGIDNIFIKVKFLVFIKSEVKVSDKEGFYDFRDFLTSRWRGFNNKVTKSFKLDEVDSESMLFKHTGESNATISEFKRFISKIFEPKYYRAVRIVYDYECKKEGDDIRVIYKGQKNVDRGGNLVQ